MIDKDGPTSVRLKYRGADVFLSDGSYIIGRSATCQLVIDDARISRRHAKLSVGSDSVTIEDLGSVNGVYVNGMRIPAGEKQLFDGDRIGVGGAELELKLGPPSPTSERRERATLETPLAAVREELRRVKDSNVPRGAEPKLASLTKSDSEPPTSGAGTQRAEVFELIGPIAGKALAQGRASEAERILSAHLTKVRDDYRRGRAVAPHTRDAALSHALELSVALASAKWLNYSLDLLLVGRVALDSRLAAQLLAAMNRVDPLDDARVAAYVSMLHELPQGYEKVRALHQAEELLKAAAARKR